MDIYLSIGRITETLMTLSTMKEFSCVTEKDIDLLSINYGINKSGAIEFAQRCKWLIKEGGEFHITEQGLSIILSFDGYHISSQMWMLILNDYITHCRPSWGALIPSGRKEAYFFMSTEDKRCFLESGLLYDTSKSVVDWWDSLADLYRTTDENNKMRIGRHGESLTIQYEKDRTGRAPVWESLDSNKVGYDIISRMDPEDDRSLYIEVKASEKSISSSVAFISRNEWDVARSHKNGYKFYFWLMGETSHLAIVDPEHLIPHMPIDAGVGRWKDAEIPFELFSSLFVEYKPSKG